MARACTGEEKDRIASLSPYRIPYGLVEITFEESLSLPSVWPEMWQSHTIFFPHSASAKRNTGYILMNKDEDPGIMAQRIDNHLHR